MQIILKDYFKIAFGFGISTVRKTYEACKCNRTRKLRRCDHRSSTNTPVTALQ